MESKTSRIAGFYKKTHEQRLKLLKNFSSLSQEECLLLQNFKTLDFDAANRMIENVVSVMPIPLGIATNFLINGKEYVVPMAIEESSIIAAASYAAKLARTTGGFVVKTSVPIMIGQIQLKQINAIDQAIKLIQEEKKTLLNLANATDSVLIEAGGGARDITCKIIETKRGAMLIVHLLVDVQDAMGANIINTMSEQISPHLEKITGGRVGVRIVSNLSTNRMVHVKATWSKEEIGEELIGNILDAYAFAEADSYRCATHNKGVMNGIDAVALATGNDFRAIEAGAHAWAAQKNDYKPLTNYTINQVGDLVGTLSMPLAVGIVGGVTQSHPMAKLCLKILGVQHAHELAAVMGAVGLAQNFAALRALVTEGISKGHMKLHSKNIAINAGAPKELIDLIAQQMIEEDNVSVSRARELLKKRNVL